MRPVRYIITFYSPTTLPNSSGLHQEAIIFEFEEKIDGEFIGMYVDVVLTLTEMDTGKITEVLRTQSQFEIIPNQDFNDNDAYEMIKHSIMAIKSYDKAQSANLKSQMERIPIEEKEAYRNDINSLLNWYAQLKK